MHRYATLLLSFLAGFLSQRRIFPLLFLIAGVLLLQSVQAQTTVITPPLVDPPLIGPNLTAPTGMFDVFGVTLRRDVEIFGCSRPVFWCRTG